MNREAIAGEVDTPHVESSLAGDSRAETRRASVVALRETLFPLLGLRRSPVEQELTEAPNAMELHFLRRATPIVAAILMNANAVTRPNCQLFML